MPVRIILRTENASSPFRTHLLRMLNPKLGDGLLICSGYIWETNTGYSILSDSLLDAIRRGCKSGGVITVAGKLGAYRYSEYYRNFVHRLRPEVPTTAFRLTDDNWHAKVAIRTRQGVPVAGIVGSSNLTAPAYALNRKGSPHNRSGWNYEADVVLWSPSRTASRLLRATEPDTEAAPGFGVIDTRLVPGLPQLSEAAQLKRIYDRVLEQAEPYEA